MELSLSISSPPFLLPCSSSESLYTGTPGCLNQLSDCLHLSSWFWCPGIKPSHQGPKSSGSLLPEGACLLLPAPCCSLLLAPVLSWARSLSLSPINKKQTKILAHGLRGGLPRHPLRCTLLTWLWESSSSFAPNLSISGTSSKANRQSSWKCAPQCPAYLSVFTSFPNLSPPVLSNICIYRLPCVLIFLVEIIGMMANYLLVGLFCCCRTLLSVNSFHMSVSFFGNCFL